MFRTPIVLVAAALAASALLWSITTGQAPSVTDSAAQRPEVVEPAPEPIDPAELDRLIDTFRQRFESFGGVTNGTTLGTLLGTRARIQGSVDDHAEAYEVLARTVAAAPTSDDAMVALAGAAADLHRFDEARRLAGEVVERDAVRLDALALLADASLAVGDYPTALASIDRLAAALPGRPEVLLRQAHASAVLADSSAALALAANAADAATGAGLPAADQALYHAAHGALATELGMPALAIPSFEVALELVAEYPPALEGRGVARALLRDHEQAAADLRAVIALAPDDLHAHLILGDILTASGNEASAETHYAIARSLADDDAFGLFNRPLAVHLLQYDVDRSTASHLAATELAARQDPAAYDLAAWAALASGDLDEARRLADRGLALGVPTPALLYRSALIAEAQGDRGRALLDVTAALELNPLFDVLDGPAAHRLLASLGG